MRISTSTLIAFFNLAFFGSAAVAQGPVSITGTVWQEKKPFDGIRDPSEAVVPAVLVKLLASDGKVVGTTISKSDGTFALSAATTGSYFLEYVYPTKGYSVVPKRAGSDNSVNSAANSSNYSDQIVVDGVTPVEAQGLGLEPKPNTITYCTMKEPAVTVWQEDLLLPKSSVEPQPVAVNIFASGAVWHPTIGIENLGTPDEYDISVQGIITLTLPKNQTLKVNSDVPKTGTLPAYDGLQDYGGTSGISWPNEYSFATGSYDYAPFLVDGAFKGNESLVIEGDSKSGVTVVGSGNQQTFVQTYVSAGACVVYQYAEGALPVTLVAFSANQEAGQVQLKWETGEETNSSHFEVEASADGKKFVQIGRVAASGESTERKTYTFTDAKPLAPVTLYRLKMVDTDETFAYSRIVVTKNNQATLFSVFPNPAANELVVRSAQEGNVAEVQLFDARSVLVLKKTGAEPIDISKLTPGTYVVRVVDHNGAAQSQKLLIHR